MILSSRKLQNHLLSHIFVSHMSTGERCVASEHGLRYAVVLFINNTRKRFKMRKFINQALLFTLMSVMALSCANLYDEELQHSINNSSELGLFSVEMDDSMSRTYVDEATKLCWHADDRVALFYGSDTNVECRFTGATGDNYGEISPVANYEQDADSFDAVYAYYPYDVSVKIDSSETLSVTLPAVQNYEEESFGRGAYAMVAVTESLADRVLKFRNICGALKLQLWGDVKVRRIKVKGNNGEVLSGAATLYAACDELPTILMSNSGNKQVELDCGDGVQLGVTVTDFFVVLPPVSLSRGFSVEIEDVEGRLFTNSTDKEVVIKRNTILPMQAFEVAFVDTPASNELWYTTTNGSQLSLSSNKFNTTISSHVKDGDKWVVKFAGDLTTLGKEAFDSQSTLKSITLPEGVTTMGDYAFYQCTNLMYINIPKGITSIGTKAFYGCNAIKELTIEGYPQSYPATWGNNPMSDTTIDTLVVKCNLVGANIESGLFDRDPLFVGAYISNVVFSPEVDSIGAYSFFEIQDLKAVTIPYGVESVGEGAFMLCKGLTELTFPESVTSIGSMVLDGCSSLTHVTSLASTPPALGSSAFPANLQVRVPDYAFAAYQNDAEWNRYALSNLTGEVYASTDYSDDGKVVVLQRATEGKGINIVFMGDGFSDRQIAAGYYEEYCRTGMEILFGEEPYKSFRNLFNVYMVLAVSKNERIDDQYVAGRTKFNTYFTDTGDVIGSDNLVNSYAAKAVGESNIEDTLIIVVLNSNYRAGICYLYAPGVYDPEETYWAYGAAISYCAMCGDADEFKYMILHEAGGHGFAKLADEYFYSGNGEITNLDYYNIVNWLDKFKWYMNVDYIKGGTKDATNVKWAHMLADERYKYEGLGVFEGGLTYPKGVYRSTDYSIMRSEKRGEKRSYNYNAPSREAIYRRIHHLAYGSSWEYDYEKFVAYDAINRKTEADVSAVAMPQSVVYGDYWISHTPPRIISK